MLLNLSSLNPERSVQHAEIKIGDEWVHVPAGYIHLESEFTGYNSNTLRLGVLPDSRRQEILDKRVEFYEVYKAYVEWLNDI